MAFPSTQYEIDGTWTPVADEGAFLSAVEAEAPGMVTVTQVGTSTFDGHPLWRAVVGSNADAPAVLITGGVHGTEPAGREAAFTFIRDLAASVDPVWVAFREAFTVVVHPSVNPTGRIRSTKEVWVSEGFRREPQGDTLHLTLNETRVVAQTFTDYRPVLSVDCHEHSTNGSYSTAMYGTANPWQIPVSKDVYNAVTTRWGAENIDWRPFIEDPPGVGFRTQSTVFGLRHSAFLLLETFIYHTPEHRMNSYAVAFDEIVSFSVAEGDKFVSGQGRSIVESRGAVRTGTGRPLYLGTSSSQSLFVDPWPKGFSELDEWPESFDVFNIEGNSEWVSADQTEGMLLIRMLHPDAFQPVTESTMITAPPVAPVQPGVITGLSVGGRPVLSATLNGKDIL